MERRLAHPLVVLGFQVAAFWPVWSWYGARITDGSDEPWCVVALITALFFLIASGKKPKSEVGSLVIPTLFVLSYAAVAATLPAIFGAAVAMLAVGSTLGFYKHGHFFLPGIWGLLLLSVPLLASLQFVLGYPLRVLVGWSTAPLLNLTGYSVTVEGTLLNWGGRLVEIDAPCSGIRMLWAGLYLTFALSAAYRFKLGKTALAAFTAVLAVIAGNVFRAASLFYLETDIVVAPPWAHTGVGVVVFLLLAFLMLGCTQQLREQET